MDQELIALNLLGRSEAFGHAMKQVKQLARTAAPVLVWGETGTGKELAARAIHYLGSRQGRAFVPVNCGAIPEALFESELFGHEQGAFTDARRARTGLVHEAEGGTLFLDELDALSPRSQVALLRFLQDFEYRPLGEQRLRKANVRIIAASNRDLAAFAREQRFREDLLFRVAVVSLRLPALRERTHDIALLVRHFVDALAVQYGQRAKHVPAELMARLDAYEWPGNVRELQNFLHAAFVTSEGGVLEWPRSAISGPQLTSTSPTPELTGASFRAQKAKVLRDFEQRFLRELLTRAAGNVSEAARLAGKERRAFCRLLDRHGLARRSST